MAFFQERIEKFYTSIQLPFVFTEEDRGYSRCCDQLLVLASVTTDTWKNDVNSAWIKLSDPTDTFSFELLDEDDNPTVYVPIIESFPNEENAFYTTIPWKDVLSSDGEGCYKIQVTYNIGGFSGSYTWNSYKLQQYSIENALQTARIRVLLNLNQTIEGINFTGANVEDCIRFNGQIRPGQPNSEYNNLIYGTRVVETVWNELLNDFIIETDAYTDEILRLFEKLYLLSGSTIFISDYNAHTSSYRVNDIKVICDESPEREQPDKYAREEILTCKVTKKVKNERTFY